jgi:hypothetical protein
MDVDHAAYGRFLDCFQPDQLSLPNSAPIPDQLGLSGPDAEFLTRYAGATFADGLYRLHPIAEIDRFTDLAVRTFPELKSRITCFARDWLGRQFAIDRGRIEHGAYSVLMLDPGAGQGLEVPATFRSFHNEELVDYSDAALAANFYQQWRSQGGPSARPEQCVGYRVPLFLGGVDTVENLELIDTEVYWVVVGQLRNKTRTLPAGTSIGQVTIQ